VKKHLSLLACVVAVAACDNGASRNPPPPNQGVPDMSQTFPPPNESGPGPVDPPGPGEGPITPPAPPPGSPDAPVGPPNESGPGPVDGPETP